MTIRDEETRLFELLHADHYPPHLKQMTLNLIIDAFRRGYVLGGNVTAEIYRGAGREAGKVVK